MTLHQDEVKRALISNILNNIDDKNVHEAAQSGILESHLADMIRPLIEEQLLALTQGCTKILEIEEAFFTSRRSFSQQFGLIVFPFFTFFDSMMERFAIELTQSMRHPSLGTLVSLGLFAPKDTRRKIAASFRSFSSAMQTQLAGMEYEGAQPFITQLSDFLQSIDQIPLTCEKAIQEKESFLFKIKDAHRQLFFSEGEEWEDTAMTAMGDVLGRMALAAMPTEQSFILALKRLHNIRMKKQIEKFISNQRTTFQENLIQFCKPMYEDAVNAITAAWQIYKADYEQRTNLFRDFLQSFPA